VRASARYNYNYYNYNQQRYVLCSKTYRFVVFVDATRGAAVYVQVSPARGASAAAERAYPAGQELVTFDVVLTSVGATG